MNTSVLIVPYVISYLARVALDADVTIYFKERKRRIGKLFVITCYKQFWEKKRHLPAYSDLTSFLVVNVGCSSIGLREVIIFNISHFSSTAIARGLMNNCVIVSITLPTFSSLNKRTNLLDVFHGVSSQKSFLAILGGERCPGLWMQTLFVYFSGFSLAKSFRPFIVDIQLYPNI